MSTQVWTALLLAAVLTVGCSRDAGQPGAALPPQGKEQQPVKEPSGPSGGPARKAANVARQATPAATDSMALPGGGQFDIPPATPPKQPPGEKPLGGAGVDPM
jgi:putative intracellular protease/amidase